MVTTSQKRGDWMQTFNGHQFWPLDPDPGVIDIDDIAHSLSMQCRYAGHCIRFYSVAEHSVHLARHFRRVGASIEIQLWALLHDATEAYLVGLPRPVKPHILGYASAEQHLMRLIALHFKLLPFEIPQSVKDADRSIIADEAEQNMSSPPVPWNSPPPLGIKIACWSPLAAKEEFLLEFDRLMRERENSAEQKATDHVRELSLENLFRAAEAEAFKAMRNFPQPNYVISKVAEEAGEVVKAAIHCAEGRDTPENVVAEIKQAMAMLIRLYIEGDQVHGLPPLAGARTVLQVPDCITGPEARDP